MGRFKNLLDFYINASIHVAAAVTALTWITLWEFNINTDYTILLFNFFATITGYNFVKYFGLAKFHHRSLAKWLRTIQIFSAVCFSILAYLTFQLPLKTIIYLAGLGVITFLYAIPFLPLRYFLDADKNLRSISGLKIYLIAIIWAIVTVIIPLINNKLPIGPDAFITGVQRFLIVLVWMIPFEIRDLQYDSIRLSTIPQMIGTGLSKFLAVVIALIFFICEFFKSEIIQEQWIISGIVTLVSIFAVVFANKNQNDYYSGFWVEAIPILWLILVMVL